MGKVTSRIDLAAFYAGLPMLAVHWVRNPDGKVNPASFPGTWAQYKEEMGPWPEFFRILLKLLQF